MRLSIPNTLIRAAALQDVAKQIDIGVQRQIGSNLTYIPVLSDPNTAIVLLDFKDIDQIDTTAPYYANGQLQNVHQNGTAAGSTPQGIILGDPAGNAVPLICRGRNVNEQAIDCTQKALLYMIDPVSQHANGTSLSRRDNDDGSSLMTILNGVLGGTIVVSAGVGWGLWKVHASKKKARTAAEAAAAAEGTITKGEHSFDVAPRGSSETPSMLSIESEISMDTVIIRRAAVSDGKICYLFLV